MVLLCQHYIPHAFVRLSGNSMRSYSNCRQGGGGWKNAAPKISAKKKIKLRSEILIICLGNMHLNV